MFIQQKLHSPPYFTVTLRAFALAAPLILLSVIAFSFDPTHKLALTSFASNSWNTLGLFSSRSSQSIHQQPSYVNGFSKQESRREKIEAVLAKARSAIKQQVEDTFNSTADEQRGSDYIPRGQIYRNTDVFLRSYEEMERVLRIYVYEEGTMPLFHHGPCRSIYSTEGNFIYEIERSIYRTKDPNEAHVFFMPFSVVGMVQYLYEGGSNDRNAIGVVVSDYIRTISSGHSFWNSTLGADHVMLSCHDWVSFLLYSTKSVPHLFKNSIRVLCNANTSEGFNPIKDVPLPEINLKTGDIKGLLSGSPPTNRSTLAFFAGGLHGHIRHLLLSQWKNKDHKIQVYNQLPTNISYESMLRNSKFCLCPSGYEVASPRVVEAIYAGCVPVLISKGYVPPLNDVLDWSQFSVKVEVEDIADIKKILEGISEAEYLRMHEKVKQVQRHFVMNGPPQRFDLFHMIIHSIWLRRLNIRL